MQIKKYETEYGGKKLKVEISDLANQANGSVLVRYGETAVFATAVISGRKREDIDFFPLVVDYEERLYAAGKIAVRMKYPSPAVISDNVALSFYPGGCT